MKARVAVPLRMVRGRGTVGEALGMSIQVSPFGAPQVPSGCIGYVLLCQG